MTKYNNMIFREHSEADMSTFFEGKNTPQQEIDNNALPVEYIEGNDIDYVLFIQGVKDKAELTNIDGHARWVVTRDDGSKYIARPEFTKPEYEKND